MAPLAGDSYAWLSGNVNPGSLIASFDMNFSHVELATLDLGFDSRGTGTQVSFGWDKPDNNEITVNFDGPDGFARIDDAHYGTSLEVRSTRIRVGSGPGDDRITMLAPSKSHFSPDRVFGVYGDDGNDTLIGSDGDDGLDGGYGDDLVIGGGGDDLLSGGLGENVIDGGEGNDTVFERAYYGEPVACTEVRLSNNKLEGFGIDALDSIEAADIGDYRDEGIRIDASAFAGPVTLEGGWGDDTLIGGAFDDVLRGSVGHDLLIGGEGNDYLIGDESWRSSIVDYLVGGGQEFDTTDGDPNDILLAAVTDIGDPIPNTTQPLVDSPPGELLGQGLDEPRDEGATLPQTLVTDAESDGEDSGLNERDGQESNPADENDSTETAATTWDDMLTNPLLTDELLAHDAEE